MFDFDPYDLRILALLQENARMPFTEIGRKVHLTSPAVAERVRRMEEAGVITGYRAQVDLAKLGYGLQSFIRMSVRSDEALEAWVAEHPEVLALHAVTGDDCAVLRVAISTPEHLQTLLKSLAQIGRTSTAIVLSTKFDDRVLRPAERPAETKRRRAQA